MVEVIKDEDNSSAGGISVTVYDSWGEVKGSGTTQSADSTTGILKAGQFRAHTNLDSDETTSDFSGPCECTSTRTITRTTTGCSVCKRGDGGGNTITETQEFAAKGHVKDDGSTALSAYDKDNLAQECSKCGHVLFGTYEQDGDSSTTDTIEWVKVGDVSQDTNGNKTQKLISLQGLDVVKWNNSTSDGNIWNGTCNIRDWLNSTGSYASAGGFYNTAFKVSEQAKIVSTDLSDVDATGDKVFLLSSDEASELASDVLKCVPTTAAVTNRVIKDSDTGRCDWWLRSKGSLDSGYAAIVTDVYVYSSGFNVSGLGYAARPVINLLL